jgi:hypothetical protein
MRDNMESQESKKVDPGKKEKPAERTDINLEEMGAEQYDYGTGGPGAGRDDSSTRSSDTDLESEKEENNPGGSNTD